MTRRHAAQARALLALVLSAGLTPLVPGSPVEAICPVPAPPATSGCCPEATPPACPACPGQGRAPAPCSPARAADGCSLAALLPGRPGAEVRESRLEGSATAAPGTAPKAPARAAAASRRADVAGSSPPLRLLGCTFRN